jgi:TolB protein
MTNRLLKRFPLLLAVCIFAAGPLAAADIFLQIQRGEKVAIGLPDFSSKEEDRKLAESLRETAKKDLLFARLFNLIEDGPAMGKGKIDFEGWNKGGSDLLVAATASSKDGSALLVAAVYELPSGNPVFQKSYKTQSSNARRLAHEFVSDLLYRFTGFRGVAQSRIAFCNSATGSKELYLIDYDGENLRRVTSDKSLVLLPRWSPDGKEILYTTYRKGNPDLYRLDLTEGRSKPFSTHRGLNSAGTYSPDGKTVVATLSYEGAPNLYLLDRSGQVLRRLTSGRAADTSPCFSPDGKKIVFISDRPGWPQVYLMDADGTGVTRLSESGYCDAPSWSPLGDKIAYSRGTNQGRHDIVVHDLASGKAWQLTDNQANNENPSFSPDGRFIVFTSTRNRRRELFVISLDGAVQKKLADIPGDSFTPAWGN